MTTSRSSEIAASRPGGAPRNDGLAGNAGILGCSVGFQPAISGTGHGRRGFTLIELLIVVLVLGIMVMLGTPLLTASVDDARLSSAVSAVRTAIEYARLLAMGSGQPCRVTLDDTNATLTVECFRCTKLDELLDGSLASVPEAYVDSNTQYEVMEDPLSPDGDYRIDFSSDMRFAGADLVVALTDSGNQVVFDDSGVPSTGGTVSVGYGNRLVVLGIHPVTGAVSAAN